jgi:hypothetical protein
MNTEDLREIIWDDLFQAKTDKSVSEIAALMRHDVVDVQAAVDHEWFKLSEGRVSIAMAAPELRNW